MICPNCHAEYVPGFTTCYDCDVALVEELPEAPKTAKAVAPQEAKPDDARLVLHELRDDPGPEVL